MKSEKRKAEFNHAPLTDMKRFIIIALVLFGTVGFEPSDLSAQENAPNAPPNKSVWDSSGWYYVHPEEPRKPLLPDVTHHILRSAKMDRDVGFNVLVPPGYETSAKRYPVVYMLHGATGHEGCRGFAPLVHQLMLDGKVTPAIWVWPNGGQGSVWRDGPDGNPHHVYVDTFLIHELIPHIDKTWRTIATREGRAVTGFSMGGYGCVRFAFKYPDTFCAALGISGGAFIPKSAEDEKKQPLDNFPSLLVKRNLDQLKGRVALRLIAGTKDFNYEPTRQFAALLDEAELHYEKEYPEGLTHADLGKYFNPAVIEWLHGKLTTTKP
jgi:enterochelin esterase-like enzyme